MFEDLIQEDINHQGQIYEMEFAVFELSGGKIASLVKSIGKILMNADTFQNHTLEQLFLKMYPVGSIYINTLNVNPSSLFGGEWVAWGSGRVPVGVDAAQEEFNVVGKEGGTKKHKLVSDEIPPSNIVSHSGFIAATGPGTEYGQLYIAYTGGGSVDKWCSHGFMTKKTQPYNNLQPYITCYMWKWIS